MAQQIKAWSVDTKTFSDDGSVSVYLGSEWLCHDETEEEALAEASVILNAIANGAHWATSEYPQLVGKV